MHDELFFECPEDRAEDFAKVVKEIMEQPPTPDWEVPIVVEYGIGDNYSEANKQNARAKGATRAGAVLYYRVITQKGENR